MTILTLLALAVLALITFLGGVSVVASGSELAHQFPEYAHLQVPLTCAALGVLVCVEAALVIIASLVWAIHSGRILEARSTRLVDALIVTIVVASAFCVAGWVFIPGPPPLGIAVIAAAFAGISLAFILVLLRSLLRQASDMKFDLDEVI